MARLKSAIDRLVRTPDEVRAENLRAWASTIRGAIPISEVQPRGGCKVAGVIRNIRIDPREGTGSIEATIFDGSGSLVARWLGRSSLQGLGLGIGLVIEGIAGVGGDQNQLIVLNPEYTLVPGPEHG
jgi:hypothetical protein